MLTRMVIFACQSSLRTWTGKDHQARSGLDGSMVTRQEMRALRKPITKTRRTTILHLSKEAVILLMRPISLGSRTSTMRPSSVLSVQTRLRRARDGISSIQRTLKCQLSLEFVDSDEEDQKAAIKEIRKDYSGFTTKIMNVNIGSSLIPTSSVSMRMWMYSNRLPRHHPRFSRDDFWAVKCIMRFFATRKSSR